SADAVLNGNDMQLPLSASGFSYGMYRFTDLTDADVLLKLELGFDALPEDYHIAIANYDSMRWQLLHRVNTPGGNAELIDWPAGFRAISPNGNVYVAVLNTGAAPVLLKTLILTIDINNEAPVADFSASIIRGNASLTVDFDATASHDK